MSNLRLDPLLAVLLAAFCMWTAAMWQANPAGAQACTTDFQCGPSAGGYNRCLGDTLITVRRLCVAGQCREQELSRINCNLGGGAGVCQGNVFVRSGGRCDALSGRCTSGGTTQIACVKSCSCRGNRLTISTGACTPGLGCGTAVLRCRKGCTCSPEPRCLEDPKPATKAKRTDKKSKSDD